MAPANGPAAVSAAPRVPDSAVQQPAPLVQRLRWDFQTSFPEPLDDAIDSGVLDEADREPQNLKSLHENYASQCLSVLAARDKVTDARRKGVDPGTGQKPHTHASRERLKKYLAEEPARLDHTFEVLIGTYADAFGQEASEAFRKAIVARHAGIEVVGEQLAVAEADRLPRQHAKRFSSALPIPKPLRSSVAQGVFGRDEKGMPIRPTADEIRLITEQHAERMIEMNDDELRTATVKYAEDFGREAAAQLERYVRRRQRSR